MPTNTNTTTNNDHRPALPTFNNTAHPLIAMVHARALPSAPRHSMPLPDILDTAVAEAKALADAGFDALILENMHDTPYLHADQLPPITVACMTRLAHAIRAALDAKGHRIPLGIQVLSGGNRHALAIAHACGLDFIRCENFAYAHVADEGLMPSAEAPTLLRERKNLNADNIRIFTDIKKKHASHAITADLTTADAAAGAHFFGSDALIVTGTSTAKPTDPADLKAARDAAPLPVLVGSGVTPDQLPTLFAHADALIVGSHIKQQGHWQSPLDPARINDLIKARGSLA